MQPNERHVDIIIQVTAGRVVAVRPEGAQRVGESMSQGQAKGSAFLCLRAAYLRLIRTGLPIQPGRQIGLAGKAQVITPPQSRRGGLEAVQSQSELHPCLAARIGLQGVRKDLAITASKLRGTFSRLLLQVALHRSIPVLREARETLRHMPAARVSRHRGILRKGIGHALVRRVLPSGAFMLLSAPAAHQQQTPQHPAYAGPRRFCSLLLHS